MHKKPFVAVLILGLLLLVSSVGLAKTVPYNLTADDYMLPYIARGVVKDAPTSPIALSGPTTIVQAGVSRTGATFCDGEWQTGGASYYPNWFVGDEFYAAYQNPAHLGSCDGLPDIYTFDVTAINWYVGQLTASQTYDMQPLVYANAGDKICPVPGAVLCGGPLYSVDLVSGFTILSLPFVDECCNFTDYFAGVYAGPYVGPGVLGIVFDDGSANEGCYTYNDYGYGFEDLINDWGFGGNIELWSEGNDYAQNSCPGVPGDCDWVSWYNGISFYTTNPGANLISERYTRFNPDLECTLVASAFYIYGGGTVGDPTGWFSVYGNNGPIFGGRMYPGDDAYGPLDPSNLIFSIEVPFHDMTTYPAAHVIDWSVEDPNWPTGYVYTTGENLFVTEGISPNTPDPVNDVLATMVDASEGAGGHSGAYFGVFPAYGYYDEVYGEDQGNALESYFCCKHVEPTEVECANAGPDDWPTWGHDYNRTCATSINVGDPCQITVEWSQPLTGALNSFCEPTIADNTVYVSSDTKLWSFGLTSGTAGNTVSGLPYIFGTNRGNVTIDGGFVYVTGGTGKSISQWDAALTAANWVNSPGGGINLDATVRFGVTAVYDIDDGLGGFDEVVVVGTENALGGELFCFKTADGSLYGGWASNPVVLDEPIWHSPSYDGTDLYVGTAHTPSGEGGSVYRIDATDGTIVWNWVGSGASEGFPGGVSLDGGYVYTASAEANDGAFRAKIDKVSGVAAWEFSESSSLYGCPAIGRNFVYIPQDGPGVLIVDKGTGAALYNFADNGVGSVTQPVTITCDNYLFAGDRTGLWWLLDINNQVPVWNVQFDGIVNGTAVANDGTDDFAVVSLRSGNAVDGGGMVAAFKFNAGVRPRVVQNSFSVDVPVPFNTGPGNAASESSVLSNDGCADLNISTVNITDPAPDVSAKSFNNVRSQYAAAMANSIVGSDYTAYFDNSTKGKRMANTPLRFVDDELTRGDVAMESAKKALVDSKRSGSRMAAGASIVRTSAVSVTSPIPAGSSTDVDWLYDGTGLSRGVDVEELEFVTDDPDRVEFGNQPIFTITYIGGCLDEEVAFDWNLNGPANEQGFYNYGRLADYAVTSSDPPHIFSWGADPEDGATYYEGSFYLAGTQSTGNTNTDSSQFYIANMYRNWSQGGFAGDPRPSDATCTLDGDVNVPMGWKRTGGCPGTPEEILGGWLRSYFVDSLQYYGNTPYAAIGTHITLTEVGSYDPEYGDFKILKWDITERNGVAQGPLYAGTWTDWDVPPSGGNNHGIVSDAFNGYAMWDWVTPSYAFGYFDPRMSTDYCGLNTAEYSPHRIQTMGQRCDDGTDGCGAYGLWQGDATASIEAQSLLWDNVVNGAPREVGPHEHPNSAADWDEDHAGMLVNKGFSLEPNGTSTVIQAEYGIDMTDVGAEGATDVAAAEAKVTALARRAAIWSGFARGDANMDGCVNLIDVCWIGSGQQIYPDTYNGDVDLSGGVDAADASYLLQYVTGLGPAPQGEWRFTF